MTNTPRRRLSEPQPFPMLDNATITYYYYSDGSIDTFFIRQEVYDPDGSNGRTLLWTPPEHHLAEENTNEENTDEGHTAASA